MTHEKYSACASSWDYKYHSLFMSFLKNIMCVLLEQKQRICNEKLAFLEVQFMLFNFTH